MTEGMPNLFIILGLLLMLFVFAISIFELAIPYIPTDARIARWISLSTIELQPIDKAPITQAFRWLAINAILPTAFAFVWRIAWWIVDYRTADNTYWLISFWAATGILLVANLTCAWLAKGAWRWIFVASGVVSIVGATLVGNPSVAGLWLQLPFIVRVVWEGNAWFWR
jgi:hypothetical protein